MVRCLWVICLLLLFSYASAILQAAPKPEDTVALKAIFDKHDDNKNGVIDKHELPAVLEDSLKRKLPASLMDKYVNTVFAKHDKDNSNTVRA